MSDISDNGLLDDNDQNTESSEDGGVLSDMESLKSAEKSEEDDSTNDSFSENVKGKRVRQQYRVIERFDTAELSRIWWNSGNSRGWMKLSNYKRSDGNEVFTYNCSKLECGHYLRFIYATNSQAVIVETTLAGNHLDEHTLEGVFSDAIVERVKELIDLDLKPAKIRLELMKDPNFSTASIPTLKQMQNLVYRLRKENVPSNPLTDTALNQYVIDKSTVPTNENEAYVIGSLPYTKNDHFLIVWTTEKLRIAQNRSKFLSVDATYKLVWQGFPIFIAGTVDVNNSFHPTYCALSSNEDKKCFTKLFEIVKQEGEFTPTHLLADGAHAITEAAELVFPTTTRLMCWAHVMKNIDKKLGGRSKEEKKSIKQDIQMLQLAISEEQFQSASKLLISKLAEEFGEDFKFIGYLRKTWLESKHSNFYEGASQKWPSTNNGLESVNKQIKDTHTFRQKLKFEALVKVIEDMLTFDWSQGREPPDLITRKVSPDIYASAYQLKRANCKVFGRNGKFMIPSQELEDAEKRDIKKAALKVEQAVFESFDDYKDSRFKAYIVTKNEDEYRCTCFEGSKKKPCKHSIFVSHRVASIEYPPDARAKLVKGPKKRGRPTLAKTQRSQQPKFKAKPEGGPTKKSRR